MREELDFPFLEGVQNENQAKIAREKMRNIHLDNPTSIFTFSNYLPPEHGRILPNITVQINISDAIKS